MEGTNVEHSFQNDNIQRNFLSVIMYHIKTDRQIDR